MARIRKELQNREVEWKALDGRVIAVAVQGGFQKDWAAYIGSVAGQNHSIEWENVMRNGAKLKREVAEAIFPNWAEKYGHLYYRT